MGQHVIQLQRTPVGKRRKKKKDHWHQNISAPPNTQLFSAFVGQNIFERQRGISHKPLHSLPTSLWAWKHGNKEMWFYCTVTKNVIKQLETNWLQTYVSTPEMKMETDNFLRSNSSSLKYWLHSVTVSPPLFKLVPYNPCFALLFSAPAICQRICFPWKLSVANPG